MTGDQLGAVFAAVALVLVVFAWVCVATNAEPVAVGLVMLAWLLVAVGTLVAWLAP